MQILWYIFSIKQYTRKEKYMFLTDWAEHSANLEEKKEMLSRLPQDIRADYDFKKNNPSGHSRPTKTDMSVLIHELGQFAEEHPKDVVLSLNVMREIGNIVTQKEKLETPYHKSFYGFEAQFLAELQFAKRQLVQHKVPVPLKTMSDLIKINHKLSQQVDKYDVHEAYQARVSMAKYNSLLKKSLLGKGKNLAD